MLSTTRSGHNFIKEVIESWGDYDITVMENCLPEKVYQYKLDMRSPRVIVIREFRNFVASSIKSYADAHGPTSAWRESIDYKVNAYRAILEEAKTKEYYDADIVIFYDEFCESQKYRQWVCRQLGGTYTEERLGFVSNEGDGSSFDKLSMQGEGDKMKTRDRYKQILETRWAYMYLEVLGANEDLVEGYEALRLLNHDEES